MNTSNLKTYAPKARHDFIEAVTQRANLFGISKDRTAKVSITGGVMDIEGRQFESNLQRSRNRLVKRVESVGFDQLMEQIAYTWFNRLCAIRYMELHDYLDHGLRVLSPSSSQGEGQGEGAIPEILTHAQNVADDLGLDRNRIVELKLAGNQDETLYRELLLGQCHQLHKAMPFLFEALDDETELLLPDNLTRTDSILRELVTAIPEEDWDNIEIIGWLYQFYISEKKDQVIGKVVKSEDIPAATQLFTPNWIVKYMVQNSLGAQWLATYPDSPIKGQMDYYIEPAEQTKDVGVALAAITPSTLNPEELTLIDPACGSGHILVEAYDLFKAIYLERGYRQRDVAQLILEKNLFGLDIDGRATQLTGFALMMKARADDRRLFERGVKLNVIGLVDSTAFETEPLIPLVRHSHEGGNPESILLKSELDELKTLFEHATTFGSLIQVPKGVVAKLPALKQLSEATSQDLFVSDALKRLGLLLQQTELLAAQYDAVVANPPYIGSKFHIPILKKFLKDHYKGYEKDVFSAFIDRDLALSKPHGRLGFMSPFVWMFILSHEHLRTRLIGKETITSLVQLEYSGFEGATVPVCTFTLQKDHVNRQKGCYIRLSDFRGSDNQGPKTLDAIRNRHCGWFFEAAQDEFKKIPGSPLAYWVSDRVRQVFEEGNRFGDWALPCQGMATTNNDLFMRFWPEVAFEKAKYDCESENDAEQSGAKWFPYNKGGKFRKWFGNNEFLVNFENRGRAICDYIDSNPKATVGSNGRVINRDKYFHKSITWSFVSSSYFGVRFSDSGAIFDVGGSSAFPPDNRLIFAAGFLCSKLSFYFLKALNPTLNFQAGNVATLPIVPSAINSHSKIDHVANCAIQLVRTDWNAYERSWDFQSLPILTASSDSTPALESSYTTWITQNRDTIAEMKRLEEENNRLFIDAYGLADELTPGVPIEQITLTVNPAYRYGGKISEEEQWSRFREDTMAELVSYAIGCMMGRYSLDEPGLIYAHSGNEGFDPSRYTSFPADDDGIVPITDTEWFSDDAANRLVKFISVAWNKSHLEENLTFLADNLTPKKNESSRDTIRRYLCNSFFKDHMKTYKKRPIYWLFSSGKQKAFQCLVYLHRYNEGTLARMRTEYVTPLLGKYDAYTDQLQHQVNDASSTSAANRFKKELVALEKKQTELQEFDDKLKHYADRRIKLDLDDGVKVNYGKFGGLLAEVKAITGKKPKQ